MKNDIQYRARKRFGQNFLVDENIIFQIVDSIMSAKPEQLVEIGPGLGAITAQLLPLIKTMEAVELDRDIIPELEKNCAGLGELKLYNQDILNFDFNEIHQKDKKLSVVGNLPYNISTPLLFHLTQYSDLISNMFFMLQKEVVDRICAQVGTKAYGRLTVMIQYHYQTDFLFNIPPTAFVPQPKVDSAFLRLVPHKEKPFVANDEKKLKQIVTQAFSMRRKTLRNTLKKLIDPQLLESLGINPQLRPENISLEQYISIANSV